MNCRQAKADIALWVGGDLDRQAEGNLKRHLAVCPDCREHWKQMRASLRVLLDRNDDPFKSVSESIWPELELRLPSRPQTERVARFNGWVPALAITAACLMIFVFANNPRQFSHEPIERRPIEVSPVRASFDTPGSIFNAQPDDEQPPASLRIPQRNDWDSKHRLSAERDRSLFDF